VAAGTIRLPAGNATPYECPPRAFLQGVRNTVAVDLRAMDCLTAIFSTAHGLSQAHFFHETCLKSSVILSVSKDQFCLCHKERRLN
jgi:hypothetical protein